MLKTIGVVAATGILALATSVAPAAAQDTVRGKQAGDLVIGLGVIGVLPESGGSVATIGGRPDASGAATAQLDLTYFFTPNIAVNLIAATTRHDVEVRNSAIGNVDLGHVWVLPPTLTLQYHPLPRSRVSPYLGIGVNYTVFYGEGGGRHPAVTGVDVHNGWGLALNAGVDVEIAPNWLFNFDVKRLQFLEPEVRVNTVLGRINANAELNPWVIGAGVRYRF